MSVFRSRLAFWRAEPHVKQFSRVAHLALPGSGAVNLVGSKPPVFPRQIKCETAACPEPFGRAVRPRFRERGQQVNEVTPVCIPEVTLQKHFRDAGGRAEIAVNL